MTNNIAADPLVRSSYVRGIDGLRAIAVLSVLIYHLDHLLLPGGFTGVDVFFVISGYVISKSLAESFTASFSAFILGFYKRRILRIVPALLFCLVLTSVLSSLFIPAESWLSRPNQETALWAFFGASNFFLVGSADGYFSLRIPFNPFVHTWSLAVEEQFYVIFPLIFYLWLTEQRKGYPRHRLAVLALLPVVVLGSLIFSIFETTSAPHRAFYLLPSRFWELGAGAILYQAQANGLISSKTLKAGRRLVYFGLCLLVVAFVMSDEKSFPFPWALAPVLGALLIIAGFTTIGPRPLGGYTGLESPLLVYIGRISYSLYLWHWPVFSLFRWTVGLERPASAFLAILLTVALSLFSYHFIENSIRRNRFLKKQASWRIVTGGLASIVAALLVTHVMDRHEGSWGMKLSVTTNACDWSGWYSPSCPRPDKVAGATQMRGKQILVVGDSHAGAYRTLVNLAAENLGASVKFFIKYGCPVASLWWVSSMPECHGLDNEVIEWTRQNANPGDIVFLASLRLQRISGPTGPEHDNKVQDWLSSPNAADMRRLATESAQGLIEQLQSLGLHVLIDAPKPIYKAPAFRCADWFNRTNPVCTPGFEISKDFLLQYREPIMVSLRYLESKYRVFVWDPFPLLCPGLTCSAFQGARPIFEDGDHLSGYGNRLLVGAFVKELVNIWANHVPSNLSVNIGERIPFAASQRGVAYLAGGWWWPEPWGVWSEGDVSRLVLPVFSEAPKGIVFDVRAHPSITSQGQRVEVWINDVLATTATLEQNAGNLIEAGIPDRACGASSVCTRLIVEFRFVDAADRKGATVSDVREARLGLVSLKIE